MNYIKQAERASDSHRQENVNKDVCIDWLPQSHDALELCAVSPWPMMAKITQCKCHKKGFTKIMQGSLPLELQQSHAAHLICRRNAIGMKDVCTGIGGPSERGAVPRRC